LGGSGVQATGRSGEEIPHACVWCLGSVLCIGLGTYIVATEKPELANVISFVCLVTLFNNMASGANFSLMPHINSHCNGFMSGIVSACGNLGGVIVAPVYCFQLQPLGIGHAELWRWPSNTCLVVIRALKH